MKMRLLPSLLFLLLTTFIHAQIYVDSSAVNGANDGTSWEDAFLDLKDALNPNLDTNEIWVARGTYKPGVPGDLLSSTFFIGKDVKLLGGFNGDENSANQRDPETNKTILSGDLMGNDVDGDFLSGKDDNVMTVVTVHTAITNATLIDGFTIQNGHSNGTPAGIGQYGGGIYCGGAPIIQNCLFKQNYARNRGGGLYLYGAFANGILVKDCLFKDNVQYHPDSTGSAGAMYIQSVGADGVQILNSTFEGNKGIYVGAISAIRTNLHMDGCTFIKNVSPYQGGAVRYVTNNPNTNLTIQNSYFEENSAAFGGGTYVRIEGDNVEVSLLDNIYKDNSGLQPMTAGWGSAGGAISLRINEVADNTTVVMDGNTFDNNYTTGVGGGVRVYNLGRNSSIQVSKNEFLNNFSDFNGGGLYITSDVSSDAVMVVVDSCEFTKNSIVNWVGGGALIQTFGSASSLSLTNSIFTENRGTYGGGAALYGWFTNASGQVNVSNCNFSDNVADYDGGLSVGSGTDAGYLEYSVTECTMVNNHANLFGGGLGLYNERPAKYTVEDCFIDGNSCDGEGGGIYVYNTSPGMNASIKNSYILNNSSDFGAGIGGAPFAEDPSDFMVTNDAEIVFENCLVASNTGTGGSVGFKQIGNVHFHNCTIAENPAGGIALDSTSSISLQNTILYNSGSVEYVDLTGTSSITSLGGNLLSDSTLADHAQPTDIVDEMFMFVGSGAPCEHYSLPLGSLAVGNGVGMGTSDFDLCGNDRVQGGQIDIGAVESPHDGPSFVRELNWQTVEVYPNPVNTYLQIDLPEHISNEVSITIESIKGETLKNQIIQSGQSIDVTDLIPGMYFLKVYEGDVTYFSKFVKK